MFIFDNCTINFKGENEWLQDVLWRESWIRNQDCTIYIAIILRNFLVQNNIAMYCYYYFIAALFLVIRITPLQRLLGLEFFNALLLSKMSFAQYHEVEKERGRQLCMHVTFYWAIHTAWNKLKDHDWLFQSVGELVGSSYYIQMCPPCHQGVGADRISMKGMTISCCSFEEYIK